MKGVMAFIISTLNGLGLNIVHKCAKRGCNMNTNAPKSIYAVFLCVNDACINRID